MFSEAENANKSKNRVRFNDAANVTLTNDLKPDNVVINEQKIDRFVRTYTLFTNLSVKFHTYRTYTLHCYRLLHLLHEANPHDENADTEEMIHLEG